MAEQKRTKRYNGRTKKDKAIQWSNEKGQSDTMAERKRTKRQTMVDKLLHRKLKDWATLKSGVNIFTLHMCNHTELSLNNNQNGFFLSFFFFSFFYLKHLWIAGWKTKQKMAICRSSWILENLYQAFIVSPPPPPSQNISTNCQASGIGSKHFVDTGPLSWEVGWINNILD